MALWRSGVRAPYPPSEWNTSARERAQHAKSSTMAKKGKGAYEIVFLACSESGDRNYTILKKTRGTKKLELKKYCPRLRKHTVHNEKKK